MPLLPPGSRLQTGAGRSRPQTPCPLQWRGVQIFLSASCCSDGASLPGGGSPSGPPMQHGLSRGTTTTSLGVSKQRQRRTSLRTPQTPWPRDVPKAFPSAPSLPKPHQTRQRCPSVLPALPTSTSGLYPQPPAWVRGSPPGRLCSVNLPLTSEPRSYPSFSTAPAPVPALLPPPTGCSSRTAGGLLCLGVPVPAGKLS